MVNPLTTLSIVSLFVETLLIAYLAAQLYVRTQTVFVTAFILIIVISYVLTTTSSAFMVRTSMDFSGRYPGKVLCFALHLCQLSLVWRFGKLILLYDQKDWFELTSLRLIHIAVQTLPFLAIHGYITFSTMTIDAVSILALAIALMSASISLTLFCIREHLHSCSWRDVKDGSSSNAKRYCGVFLLLLGTTLALSARFACVVLMSLVVHSFVLIPIVLHMIILIFGYMSCKAVKSKSLALKDVLVRIGLSYLNIFDLVERDIQKVQCTYVSFYTVILIENIVMVAVWLMKSHVDYITKLIVIVTILALFICALVLKFASCGFITTPSSTQLIQSETPDNATITEGKNIIKAISPIPSISSSVPHVLNNETFNGNVQESLEDSRVDRFTVDEPSSRSTPRINSEGDGRRVSLGSRIAVRHKVSVDPRGNDSTTDYGTYGTGTGTPDSYSIDDPTHVSRYASQDSSLVCQTRAYRKGKRQTVSNHKPRERSEVSLDICSSNSRNTNTMVTSVIETSQTSGVQPPNVKSGKDKKIIFPLGNISSKWTKINLRLPSVSNFLVRSREKTFKPYVGSDNVANAVSSQWNESDTLSMSTTAFENTLHKQACGQANSQSLTDVTDGTAVRVVPPATDTKPIRGQQLTHKDRVQLWLADIKRSQPQPLPTCQCSSESHSSDCTYVAPPNTKVQDVPKFEDFLADVPPHPEESFVVSSKQKVGVNTQKHKPKSTKQYPTSDPSSQRNISESQLINQSKTELPSKQGRRHKAVSSKNICEQSSVYSKEWNKLELSPDTTDRAVTVNEQRHKSNPYSSKRPESEVQVAYPSRPRPIKHKRSFSETCSDSTAMLELGTVWLTDSQSQKQSQRDNDPVVPFIIKLGAMESLV